MKSEITLSIVLALVTGTAAAAQLEAKASPHLQSWPAGASPQEIGKRVAERFVASRHPNFGRTNPPNSITYPETCTWYGALAFARGTGDTNLTGRLITRFEPLFGAESRLIPRPSNVDATVFGAVPLEIYLQTRESKFLDLGKTFADKQWETPQGDAWEKLKPEVKGWVERGLSWHTRFWIDDMFMITMVQSQAYRATGDARYVDRAALEMVAYLDELQQPNGLFFHAPDVPFFWGRGNGWMAAGMSQLLRALPQGHRHRARILEGYRKMMAALLKYQAQDGMWRQLIDHPESWPESSCTGMFTFALINGVKHGWLQEETYAVAARKAWLALITYIDENSDVREVCEGTNKKNDLQYYLDRKRRVGDMHGQAPVLWCAEALLALGVRATAAPVQSLYNVRDYGATGDGSGLAQTNVKTSVLVVTGGHGFEKEPFFKLFADNPEIRFTAAAHASATNASAYERADLLQHEVVVLYDMPKEITAGQQARFRSLLEEGIGLVVLHHALVSYPGWPEYEQIIGGRYVEPDPNKPGTVTGQAGYQHDVEVPVVIVATNHPVTAGLKDFTIQDEIYWGYRAAPDVIPLLTTTHPRSGKPLAWARTHGRSRVVFIQLGHGKEAFQNENFRRLLAQAIRWTAKASDPRVFLLDANHLATTRQRLLAGDTNLAPAREALVREADGLLNAKLVSVMDKKVTPPSGDKHDYMSQAPYFWPNPASSNGLPYIRRDGERNPEINKIPDHGNILGMPEKVQTLALAFYFTGEECYAAKAADFLRAWFLDPATRMNPHFKYAQAIPGVNTGRGIGLIESRGLVRVVDAVGLLAGSQAWTESDQRQLQQWYAAFLQWMLESDYGKDEAAAKNNHGTYYDLQVASFALFLDQRELATNVLSGAKTKRIAVQIEPDGRQPLELARTRAWSYSQGNLSGLMSLAKLGQCVGVDLWTFETSDGRSIRKAFDFLLPFGVGEKPWPYPQLSGSAGDGFGPLLRQAAQQFPDPQYRRLAERLASPPPASRDRLLHPQP